MSDVGLPTTPAGSLIAPLPPRGSIGNPLTEADLPFTVEDDGCYWIKLGTSEPLQLPFSPAGATLTVEVRREGNPQPNVGDTWRSLDKRDNGLIVTVLEVTDEYVAIKRFRKSRIRRDRFFREYAFVRTL